MGPRCVASGPTGDHYIPVTDRSWVSYTGTAPITRASGKHRIVLARFARNRRLADTLYQRVFSSLTRVPTPAL